MMTRSKIGPRIICDDPTPHCYFRNVPYRFKIGKQLLNVKDYCKDGEEREQDPEDAASTTYIRRCAKSLGRYFVMSKLKQTPMFSFEDGAALLLGKDNSVGLDYLTYRSPLYKKVIQYLVDELVKNGSPLAKQAALILPTDYSMSAPFASMIRRDHRMEVCSEYFNMGDSLQLFRTNLERLFERNFLFAEEHLEMFCPPRNSSKSVGFFDVFPDGTRYAKGHDFYVPSFLSCANLPAVDNMWARANHYPIKKAWLESGALLDNFQFFLANCDKYDDDSVFIKAFNRCCCSVHTEAYRLNNADETLNDLTKGFSACAKEGFYKKNRVVSYELPNGLFFSGTLEDQEYSNDLRKINEGSWGTLLKKRPMFPGPNATFSTPFILLFRLLLGYSEDGRSGFPSSRTKNLDRVRRFLLKYRDCGRTIVTFDRKTSEQFITDNIEAIIKIFPEWLQDILRGLLKSVVPSLYGPRVVKGLLSGTAATTFLNAIVGLYECCRQVCAVAFGVIDDHHLGLVINKVFEVFLKDGDEIEINGFNFLLFLGTDDQIFYVTHKNFTDEDVKEFVKRNIAKAKSDDGNSLSLEVSDSATVFGLYFTTKTIDVNPVLGLSKVFLFEKSKLGDNIAVKYAARFSLLTDYYDLFKFVYKKFGLGSLLSYGVGSENYFRMLAHFGFQGFTDLWNEHSPTEKIVMGLYLQKSGIDPAKFADKYTTSEMQPFVNEIKSYWRKNAKSHS